MFFVDKATVHSSRITNDGFKVTVAKSVRSGIQQYLANEIGLEGSHVVNVYRSPEAVKDSLASFSHVPVTLGHPSEPVTSANWKDYAVGEVSTAAHVEGEWISLPIVLKDERAIQHDHVELSAGYSAKIIIKDGIAPCGTAYQAEQVDISANHLAIVEYARAGHEARIVDSAIRQVEVEQMEFETIVIGDSAVEVKKGQGAFVTAFKDAAKTAHESLEVKVGELTAQLADAKSKVLTDADIEKRVNDRVALVDSARTVKADIVTDGKSDAEIRKEVVSMRYGASAVEGIADSVIEGMFRAATIVDNNPVKDIVDGKQVRGNEKTFDQLMADAAAKFVNREKDSK